MPRIEVTRPRAKDYYAAIQCETEEEANEILEQWEALYPTHSVKLVTDDSTETTEEEVIA